MPTTPNAAPSMSSTSSSASWAASGILVASVVAVFSTYFPFWSDPTMGEVSPIIYQRAAYQYHADSLFDNTPLTYITDYMLAMVMGGWVICMGVSQRHSKKTVSEQPSPDLQLRQKLLDEHVFRSRGLLFTYLVSVTAGGLAHHFFTTVESRNTPLFRILWTICVGTVTAASGWMGSIGTVWAKLDHSSRCGTVPVVPETFWIAFSAVTTLIVALGGWSYQRPACDTFVAGITQFPSTFYVMTLIWKGLPLLPLSTNYRRRGAFAWILNAPLLPLYPILISTGLQVGQINAILHACLCVAWSSQGSVLRTVAHSMAVESSPPPRSLPVKPKVF